MNEFDLIILPKGKETKRRKLSTFSSPLSSENLKFWILSILAQYENTN